MQLLILTGRVGKDAEVRRSPNGDPVMTFSLAVDNGKDRNGQRRPATWFDCAMWGERGEKLAPHIGKGMFLTLRGRPGAREHEGKIYLTINVDDLSFAGGAAKREEEPEPAPVRKPVQQERSKLARDINDEIPF